MTSEYRSAENPETVSAVMSRFHRLLEACEKRDNCDFAGYVGKEYDDNSGTSTESRIVGDWYCDDDGYCCGCSGEAMACSSAFTEKKKEK